MGKILQSRDIDYLVSPFNYADRTLGSGLLLEHVPLASVYAHGKAFFEENDLYTDTGRPDGDFRGGNISIGVAETWEETLAYLRLSFGQAIIRGKHQWFAELAGWLGEFKENFSNPRYLDEVRHLNDRADELLIRDRRSVTELAFVLDEKSVAHLTLDHKGFLKHVYRASVSWGHTGAPFDLVLLEDLVENRCPPYRLVVPACVKISESIDRLREWLGRTSTRAWWDGTPEWYPPVDAAALIGRMEGAGVHRYIAEDATAWANASMVLIHVAEPGMHTIRFRRPCGGMEFFSNQKFDAPSGDCDWPFETNGTALFLIESQAV